MSADKLYSGLTMEDVFELFGLNEPANKPQKTFLELLEKNPKKKFAIYFPWNHGKKVLRELYEKYVKEAKI